MWECNLACRNWVTLTLRRVSKLSVYDIDKTVLEESSHFYPYKFLLRY